MDGVDPSKSPKRLCTAHKSNGEPCGRPPIRGGSVCATHGGSAPQVRKAANLRLAAAVDPAIDALLECLKKNARRRLRYPAQALGAANSILDRAGFKQAERINLHTTASIIDVEQAKSLSTEEIDTLIPLLEKIATEVPSAVEQTDATES